MGGEGVDWTTDIYISRAMGGSGVWREQTLLLACRQPGSRVPTWQRAEREGHIEGGTPARPDPTATRDSGGVHLGV